MPQPRHPSTSRKGIVMAKTLSFLDKSFWITESDENPKHVACLQLLAIPKGAKSTEYVPQLFQEIRSFARATSPFNCAVKTVLGYPVGFAPVKKLNMDYHVQIHHCHFDSLKRE